MKWCRSWSVTFSLNQTRKTDETVDWIATVVPSKDEDLMCEKVSNVAYGHASEYTATCTDGYAVVSVFVHDNTFADLDKAAVPEYCRVDGGEQGNTLTS